MISKKSKIGSSHALHKRCPLCKQKRAYYEPDGNHGGEDHRLRGPGSPFWMSTPFGKCCGFCVVRNVSPEFAASNIQAFSLLQCFIEFYEKPLKPKSKYMDLKKAKEVWAEALRLQMQGLLNR